MGLFGVKFQAIDLYSSSLLRQRRFSIVSTTAQHHKVIRVSHHPRGLLEHLIIQDMKVDVGQQRADDCALRCAELGRSPFHVLEDVLMQIALDQPKDTPIADALLDALHQPRMRDRIEVALKSASTTKL